MKQLHIASDNKESKAPGAAGRTVFENDEKKKNNTVCMEVINCLNLLLEKSQKQHVQKALDKFAGNWSINGY